MVSTRFEEGCYVADFVVAGASMDVAMSIFAVAAAIAVVAMRGKGFDVTHIPVEVVHSVNVVVSTLPMFQPEGEVIVYVMFVET